MKKNYTTTKITTVFHKAENVKQNVEQKIDD